MSVRFCFRIRQLGVIGITVVSVGLGTACDDSDKESGKLNFEPEAWKTASLVKHDDRLRMYDDLVNQHVLIGQSPDQIQELLGDPTERFSLGSLEIWEYRLGPASHPIDTLWLQLEIDTVSNVVKTYRLTSD